MILVKSGTCRASLRGILRNRWFIAVTVVLCDIGLPGQAGAQSDSHPVYGDTDTVRVRAKPITLAEIIARCVEGERHKLAGHRDMTYTATTRTIVCWKAKKEIEETVHRVFADSEGDSRSVQLAERKSLYKLENDAWVLQPAGKDEESFVEVQASGYSDFVELPFFLEAQHEFEFELLERTLEEDHVVFKIGFKPKSSFKPLPSGIVYVDTDRYRIIHEQFEFEQNPFPLLLKDMKRISRHWQELPSGEWVFTRILVDIDLRGGWFGKMPDSVGLALVRDSFEFDRGYDARLFGER